MAAVRRILRLAKVTGQDDDNGAACTLFFAGRKISEPSMSADAMQWYRSKVDWWIALLLCVPPMTSAALCVSLAFGAKSSDWPSAVGGILFVVAIYAGLLFPLKYGLDDTHLLVRFGLCRRRIRLADISEVYSTHNPLSSPALSLDRLHVQFGPGIFEAVMISPADRDRFLNDLAQKTGLKREGNRLVRFGTMRI